jgi:spermidine/putrescine transport system substrate-binding protein
MKNSLVLSLVFDLLFSACAGATPTPSPEATRAMEEPTSTSATTKGSLAVFEWSGYELPEFWQPFADKYPDVEVNFSFFAEDAEALAKLQSGFEVDVLHPCNSWISQLADNGLIQPLDTSRLTHWPEVIEMLAERGQYQGKQYLMPWEWGFESILVRTDKVKEIPDSWTDLWDPQYKGHVTVFDSGETAWVMTAITLGFDPYNTTPEQQAAIKQKLIDLKPNLLNYWTDYTEILQQVASGDVWIVGNAWPDAFLALHDEGVPVEYIEPKEGRMGYVCGLAISSTVKNPDFAYAYLDAALSPQSMANMSNMYGYGASNAQAIPLTEPEKVKLLQLDQPDLLNRTFFYKPLTSEQRELFVSTWTEVKAAP